MFESPERNTPHPQRIAVVCLRRLGDVLLTAPLIRSLRQAYPDATIDALVFAGTEGVLAGNPDLDGIVSLPVRGGWRALLPLRRRYDLALCTQASDRPHLISLWVARHRVSVVPARGGPGYHWKRWLSRRWTELPQGDTHTVVQYLRLAEALGIAPVYAGSPPRTANDAAIAARLGDDWRAHAFAIVHPPPKFRYKAWTSEGWRQLVAWLCERGLRVVVTGGGGADEIELGRALAATRPAGQVISLAGTLQFGDLTWLMESARVFVGPDTSVTHLAAMTGVPTVALFGPSSPRIWAPWPAYDAPAAPTPWQQVAPQQQCGNVWLLQGLGDCVPCLLEGCERHINSASACLDLLPAQRVIDTVARVLDQPPGRSRSAAAASTASVEMPRQASSLMSSVNTRR